MTGPLLIEILHWGTPRTGNPTPKARHDVAGRAVDELDERGDIFFPRHVLVLGHTDTVAALGMFGGLAELAVVVRAKLDEQPVDSGPRPRFVER